MWWIIFLLIVVVNALCAGAVISLAHNYFENGMSPEDYIDDPGRVTLTILFGPFILIGMLGYNFVKDYLEKRG
jgi:hypothetical protein